MIVELGPMSSAARYFLLTQTVIPRPIAWVLSENEQADSFNVAPFSFFNAIASDPPLVLISVSRKDDGAQKDTWRNIARTGRFNIHIPRVDHAEQVQESSVEWDYGDSEVNRAELSLVKEADGELPRIQGCPIAFYCHLFEIKEIPPEPIALILGRVERIFLDDQVAHRDGKRLVVDPARVDPLVRLGAGKFGALGTIFPAVRKGTRP